MYDVVDLFDMRSVVGAKLETLLTEREYTKAGFCKAAGISRPTLDKLLSGNITSKTNYEKHIEKVLACLSMTPDMLIGNARNKYNRFRILKNILRMNVRELSKYTGISVKRLKEIEAGESATLAELRDIAFVFNTSVRCLLGTNYFDMQLSLYGDFLIEDEKRMGTGFWGHIGILPSSSEQYVWYPITESTMRKAYDTINQERMVIPCMNNKILLFNTKNIDKIIFLDDACDQPGFGNWDHSVDCGQNPPVLYEALEDYIYDTEISEDDISINLRKCLDKFIEGMKADLDDIAYFMNMMTIYYPNGKIEKHNIDFGENEDISTEISLIYDFGECSHDEKFFQFSDDDGVDIFVNSDTFSIIELPLLKVEDKICKEFDEAE